ncbi:uncharacterized protein B0P05DRAFT_589370 [Gilbertella persicaria]|uniref:uncharacterized protein n=1 Tax=Gilbertella persicaria TaxID=101096 RepID=UPI00221FCACF|nr:uncharacterized protein B0P05DRAFT_589369 [Gilbertella persicaria]XP_051432522.1 uncharacterized protein B0P05DRAFT_589370 [Gilbertella persicaria]KAI8069054.1 hypothetical protein B0P05DRAFT_589369 [Gilbertella persicaria]KAI8069055.1 hypothetical protein B0P05DRAFT_589370 [Gilbertella persicaria]
MHLMSNYIFHKPQDNFVSKITCMNFNSIFSLLIYGNTNKDHLFKYLQLQSLKAISAIHDVDADNNCGFRAVKDDMLATYMKYKDTLYKAIVTSEASAKYEEQKTINRFQSKAFSCLSSSELWFSTFTCPQIVAYVYEKPVLVYSYIENMLKKARQH